jgi:YHS domain-containing protein
MFKEMAIMDTDPVCGMSIEREKAPASTTIDDVTYYFCSRGCMREFEESRK